MKAHGGVIFLEIIAVEVIMDFCKNLMQCKLLGENVCKLNGYVHQTAWCKKKKKFNSILFI